MSNLVRINAPGITGWDSIRNYHYQFAFVKGTTFYTSFYQKPEQFHFQHVLFTQLFLF